MKDIKEIADSIKKYKDFPYSVQVGLNFFQNILEGLTIGEKTNFELLKENLEGAYLYVENKNGLQFKIKVSNSDIFEYGARFEVISVKDFKTGKTISDEKYLSKMYMEYTDYLTEYMQMGEVSLKYLAFNYDFIALSKFLDLEEVVDKKEVRFNSLKQEFQEFIEDNLEGIGEEISFKVSPCELSLKGKKLSLFADKLLDKLYIEVNLNKLTEIEKLIFEKKFSSKINALRISKIDDSIKDILKELLTLVMYLGSEKTPQSDNSNLYFLYKNLTDILTEFSLVNEQQYTVNINLFTREHLGKNLKNTCECIHAIIINFKYSIKLLDSSLILGFDISSENLSRNVDAYFRGNIYVNKFLGNCATKEELKSVLNNYILE